MTTTITQKGQITIPVQFRRALNLQKGSRCMFVVRGDELTLIPIKKEMELSDFQVLFKENLKGSSHFMANKAAEKSLEH